MERCPRIGPLASSRGAEATQERTSSRGRSIRCRVSTSRGVDETRDHTTCNTRNDWEVETTLGRCTSSACSSCIRVKPNYEEAVYLFIRADNFKGLASQRTGESGHSNRETSRTDENG